MELLWALQEDARRVLRRQRFFRNRTDVLDTYDDARLIKDYRFPRHIILDFVRRCQRLEPLTKKATAIPVHIQVLATLRFLARATFQDDCKDIVGISQPSVSKIVDAVCTIFCEMRTEFIRFPSEEELSTIKQKLYHLSGIPNCIGVIDGTHIFIHSPSGDIEVMFVCRKGGHSINVQIVCDADNRILDVVVKWPGSTHDSFIWNGCGLRAKFVREPPSGWLLGDSGYAVEPWLMPPYDKTPTQSHRNFNAALRKTRSVVERTIGLWKNVFRRIDKSGGVMLYTPEKAFKIIMATAVLHNIRRSLNLPEDAEFQVDPQLFEFEDQDTTVNTEPLESTIRRQGCSRRDEIREGFFSIKKR